MNKKKGPNYSGEKQLELILKELNLPFERNKKLKLEKDSKKYRIPDFYITKYDLVIEYFGSWENKKNKAMEKKERARFMEKVGAYEESGVDCIYLYPEDLKNAKQKIETKIELIKSHNSANKIAETLMIKTSTTKTIKTNEYIMPTKESIITETPTYKIETKKQGELIENELLRKIILFLEQ